MHFAITEKSGNAKVGPLMVVTATRETCWKGCPLMGAGCYADHGNVGMLWQRISDAPAGAETVPHGANGRLKLHSLTDLVRAIRTRHRGEGWRYAQAGDLPGIGPRINRGALDRIVAANRAAGARGWTYTHKPVLGDSETARDNRTAIAAANAAGFVINLSGNNLAHADQLADLGIAPVTTVLPVGTTDVTYTPAGRKVVPCPAEAYSLKTINCATCMLCAIATRDCLIGFPAHGTRKAMASKLAKNN